MKKYLSLFLFLYPFVLNAADYTDSAEYMKNQNAWDAINLAEAYTGEDGTAYGGASGKGVRVAVIDNGFLATHQEFKDKIDVIGAVQAQNHGTHVAGIIGAAKDDLGMHGVAYDASLAVFASKDIPGDDSKANSCTACSELSDIFNTLAGEEYKDIKIVNASWGFDTASLSEQDKSNLETALVSAMKAISDKLFVAAAGNDMKTSPMMPALTPTVDSSIDNVLNVVAFNPVNGKSSPVFLAGFSNLAGDAAKWTITAPGSGIYSAVGTGDDAYQNMSGSSMAAPIVSGVAALVQEKYPFFSGKKLADVLLTTADNDFSKFSPYAIQTIETTNADNSKTTKQRFIYFTDNTAGEDGAVKIKEDVMKDLNVSCDDGSYECIDITYAQAYGAGILDAGKAVKGLGALDADRMGTEKTYTVDTAGYDAEFANDISERNGTGLGIEKAGKGTLTLSGSNSYTGETVVSGGALKLTGTLAGDVSVGGTSEDAAFSVSGGTVKGEIVLQDSADFSIDGGTVEGTLTTRTADSDGSNVVGAMTSGTLTNVVIGGTDYNETLVFGMSGGTISESLSNAGKFTMDGGRLGGTVENGGVFDYYGGTIASTLKQSAAGVFNNYGTFTVKDGISGGVVNNKAGAAIASSFTADAFVNEGDIVLMQNDDGSLTTMTVSGTADLISGRFVPYVNSTVTYKNGTTTVLTADTLTVGEAFKTNFILTGLIGGTVSYDGKNLTVTITYRDMNDPANTPGFDDKERQVLSIFAKMFDDHPDEFSGYFYLTTDELQKSVNSLRDRIQPVANKDLPLSGTVANNIYSHLFQVRQQRAVAPAPQRTPPYYYRGRYWRGRSGGDYGSTAKVWAQFLGGHGRFDASDRTDRSTAKTDMLGGQFGWDWQSSDRFLWGLTAGFASTRIKQDGDEIRIADYRAGIYTGYRSGRFTFDTVLSGGLQKYESDRSTDIAGLSTVSKASYNGYTVEAGVNAGFEIGSMPRRDYRFGMHPYVSANAAYSYREEYKEKGQTSAANLAVGEADDTTVSVQPGVQLSYTWSDAVLTLDAGWQRLLTGGAPTTKAYFLDDASKAVFESLASEADKDYLSLSVGFESNLSRRVRVKLWADQKRSEHNIVSMYSVALQYSF